MWEWDVWKGLLFQVPAADATDCYVPDNKHPRLTLLCLVSMCCPGQPEGSTQAKDMEAGVLWSWTPGVILLHQPHIHCLLTPSSSPMPTQRSQTWQLTLRRPGLKGKSAFILRKYQGNMLGPSAAPGMRSRPHQALSRQGKDSGQAYSFFGLCGPSARAVGRTTPPLSHQGLSVH